MDDIISVDFPFHATIAGVAVVTIPVSDYAALLESKVRLAELGDDGPYHPLSRSPLENDVEVKAFFVERVGKATMVDLLRDCRLRFGQVRTPSKAAAYRFWARLRQKRQT